MLAVLKLLQDAGLMSIIYMMIGFRVSYKLFQIFF